MSKIFGKVLLIVVIVAALIGVAFGLNYFENYEEYFYVQIDNEKISEARGSDEMHYEYELLGYNGQGNSKTITFKTVRELRNHAYLKVLVKATGVNRWEEVQFDEIPAAARGRLAK